MRTKAFNHHTQTATLQQQQTHMKRVATVGAKFYKSHKIVHSSSSPSFSSLSELAEQHGQVYEDNVATASMNADAIANNTATTSPRKALRHANTCDDLSNVFENLSLAEDSSNLDAEDTLPQSNDNDNDTISDDLSLLQDSTTIIATTKTKTSRTTTRKKKTSKVVIPPQSDRHKGKKTIVLDLDETLIKSFYNEPEEFDFTIDIQFPHMGKIIEQHVYIKKRPGLDEFLQTLAERFELIMFTAALPVYANEILKQIDPLNTLFSSVLYRHHCNGSGVFPGKDLRLLGRDLNHTILIDDGVMNFMQPKNGLLIKSFKGEDDDKVLMDIIAPFLLQLDSPDRMVYEVIEQYRNFLAVTYTFEYADSIEKSHYSYYINLASKHVENQLYTY